MWKKICSEYWKTNSDNLENQFCNAGSFAMAMRMKYKDNIDDTANHWNLPPGESSPNLNRKKFQDFQEYMGECEDMNEKSESDVEASHTQKQSGEEDEEGSDHEEVRGPFAQGFGIHAGQNVQG